MGGAIVFAIVINMISGLYPAARAAGSIRCRRFAANDRNDALILYNVTTPSHPPSPSKGRGKKLSEPAHFPNLPPSTPRGRAGRGRGGSERSGLLTVTEA